MIHVSMAGGLCLSMLVALAPAEPAGPDLKLPASSSLGRQDRAVLPFRLFSETLRGPFDQDWGGETFLYRPISTRASLGLFMRAWNEAICVRPSCQERAIEAGIELRYQIKPGVDLGAGLGAQRSAGQRSGPAVLPRVHLKF